MASELAKRIREATQKSIKSRNRYTDRITAQLTKSLNTAEQDVAKSILKYRSLGSLPENKLPALNGLKKLQAEIKGIMKQLKSGQTLLFKNSTKESFKLGISQSIEEFNKAALPFYADLTPDGIDKLATKVFSIIDTGALASGCFHDAI